MFCPFLIIIIPNLNQTHQLPANALIIREFEIYQLNQKVDLGKWNQQALEFFKSDKGFQSYKSFSKELKNWHF